MEHTTQQTSEDDKRPPARPLEEKDILCLGHLKRVFALLDGLHEVGCERDKAGNRKLFFDDYVKLVLLYAWNPLIQSVHDLQQVLKLPKVARALGINSFSAGSFSESVRVFDPELLKPILAELIGQSKPLAGGDRRLGELQHLLTLVDGTIVTALARLARAAVGFEARYNTSRAGKGVYGWRLHIQLDLATFSPHRIDRTGARNAGENRENNVLAAHLEPGRCYVGDGGYADRRLFDDIHEIGSSYVIRAQENSVCLVIEERELSQEALDAGVVRDAIVTLSGPDTPAGPDTKASDRTVRRVEVQVEPHPRRTRTGTKLTTLIVLYTNLLDLPPELIALIYQQRYTVELFFRVFKQLLGMRRLLSERQEGIDIQVNCTLIVCVLIQLISGKKPNKAMRNIVGWYLLGLATEQDVIDFVKKPDNTGVKLRAQAEQLKKLGF